MPSPSVDHLLAGAVAAAERAGAVLSTRFGGVRRIERKASSIDLVTDADRAAETAALEALRERFPDHAVLAEEGGATGASPYRWIVDPLDGTTNFAHELAHFCVSVACEVDGTVEVGAILDPMRGELFTAALGRGARLNGAPIRTTAVADPGDALLATGFPYWVHDRTAEVTSLLEAFLGRVQGVRRFGSAALDLAYVACGRYDAFYERGLKPWDVAAGLLLVTEAGGRVSGIDGSPVRLDAGHVLAAAAPLHPQLVEIARPHLAGLEL
jgi:myo-inositol-1(or 4)-monophosphatase